LEKRREHEPESSLNGENGDRGFDALLRCRLFDSSSISQIFPLLLAVPGEVTSHTGFGFEFLSFVFNLLRSGF